MVPAARHTWHELRERNLLHKYAGHIRSSQAFAINLFGLSTRMTLRVCCGGRGPVSYLVSWASGIGFYMADNLEETTNGTDGQPTPDNLPIEKGIAVSLLAGKTSHFEFNHPTQKVTAVLRSANRTYQPQERGGGARRYLTFKLHPLFDSSD